MSDAFWLLAGLYVLQMACGSAWIYFSQRLSARQFHVSTESYKHSMQAMALKLEAIEAERDAVCARFDLMKAANETLAERLKEFEDPHRIRLGDKGTMQ